jgi:hypothetical protein
VLEIAAQWRRFHAMTILFAARFGSPEEPVVLFAGAGARALVEDDALLFGTLDALGCGLDELRAMSLNEQSSVIATLHEPVEALTPILMMAERLGVDVVDGAPTGERHHAFLKRPARVRCDEQISLLSEDYFQLRFPNGREPTREEIARALCLVGRYDRAAEVLRDEVRSRPDDAPLHFHVGSLLERAGGRRKRFHSSADRPARPGARSAIVTRDRARLVGLAEV